MCIFIFLSFCINILNVISEPLILNFKTRKMNDNNLMKTLINNDIYTYFYFGSNKQQIEMNIKLEKSSTFILSVSCPNNIYAKKFDESSSNSFKIILEKKQYFMYEFSEATLSMDNLIIKQNNNKDKEMKEYKLMLANTLWDNYQEYMGGMLGLKLQNKEEDNTDIPEQTDFINQLKAKNVINSYVFFLEYTDNFNGKLYVGEYYHTFNKNYSANDLIITKAGNENFRLKNWEINLEKIIMGNTIIQNKTYLQLYYELGIIAAPKIYYDYINHTFFNYYFKNGICQDILNFEEIASFKKYNYIVCDKNKFDKKSFPRIKFNNIEMEINFTLTYEDLFYEHDNKIYFLIIFPVYPINVEYWLMGKPFMKKYKLLLDKDKKIIGLYKDNKQYKEEEDDDKLNPSADYAGYIATIIILFIVLIVSLIAILYYFLVIKKTRRVRANELDDNTDYIPQKDFKEEDNQFIIN